MFLENGYIDSLSDKHITRQMPCCCCCFFIIDKRHFFVASVSFFVFHHFRFPGFLWQSTQNRTFIWCKRKNARTWVENILFSGRKTCALNTLALNQSFHSFIRYQSHWISIISFDYFLLK